MSAANEFTDGLAVMDCKPLEELFTPGQLDHIRTTQPVGLLDHLTGESHGSIGIKQPMYWPGAEVVLTASEYVELTKPVADLQALEGAARQLLELHETCSDPEHRNSRAEYRNRASVAWRTILGSGLTVDQALEYVCYGRVESQNQFLQWVLTFIGSNVTARQARDCDRMVRSGETNTTIANATGMTYDSVVRHRRFVGIPSPKQFDSKRDDPEFMAVVNEHAGARGRGRNGGFRVGYRRAVELFGPRLSERTARRRYVETNRQLVMA